MSKLFFFLPLKLRLFFWKITSVSKLQLRSTRALTALAILISLFSLNSVFAESISVHIQIKANGNFVVDKTVTVPNGCTVTDVQGEVLKFTGYKVVCALQAATDDFSVSLEPSGLWLESLEGYIGKSSDCKPSCWTYDLNSGFASSIDTTVVASGNTLLFKYGTSEVTPSSSQGEATPPTVTTTSIETPAVQTPASAAEPIVQPQESSPSVAISPQSQPVQPVSVPAVGNCTLALFWPAYESQRKIFYGKWDRSYTAFLFEQGKTRDEAVWKGQTRALSTSAVGLKPYVNYVGEVFLTGAFLTNDPFWFKLPVTKCGEVVATKAPPRTSQLVNQVQSDPANKVTVQNQKTPTAVVPGKAVVNNSLNNIEKALNYLRTQQNSSGQIENQVVSSWSALAFAALGDSNSNLLNSIKKNQRYKTANDVERTILAAIATGEDPKNFGNINLIQKLEEFHKNSQVGAENSVSDDVFCLLALEGARQVGSVVFNDCLKEALANQNKDGGWGFQNGTTSDTDTTSAAIQALEKAITLGKKVDSKVIDSGVSFLKKQQNTDGGFRFNNAIGSSNGASTAWAIQALISAKQNTSQATSYLLTLQNTDGSFKTSQNGQTSNLVTAYAVLALIKKPLPIEQGAVLGISEVKVLPDTGADYLLQVAAISFILLSGLLVFKFDLRTRKFKL